MISDNQRRTICRILFLLICVAPTSLVVYWMCHPQTAAQWQRDIQSQLGVVTTIDAIETPGPYVTVLRGLKFTDPELGTLLDAVEARIEFGATNRVIIPQRVRMTNAGIIQLVQTINEHLIRAHAADRPWQIFFLDQTIIQETIHSKATGSQFPATLTAQNLQLAIQPMIDSTMTTLQFQLPELDSEKWVYCALSRFHTDANQQSHQRLELNTNKIELPCWLLGDLIPEIKTLGPHCQFAGRVDVFPRNGNPYGGFDGNFTQIDASFITDDASLDPNIRFAAEVQLCRFDGGIEKLEAYLIRPDRSTARIQETLTVIEQFDVGRALRTAAQSNAINGQQADTQMR